MVGVPDSTAALSPPLDDAYDADECRACIAECARGRCGSKPRVSGVVAVGAAAAFDAVVAWPNSSDRGCELGDVEAEEDDDDSRGKPAPETPPSELPVDRRSPETAALPGRPSPAVACVCACCGLGAPLLVREANRIRTAADRSRAGGGSSNCCCC